MSYPPPGSSFPASADKPGLYTPCGFTTSPYPPGQQGLPPGQAAQRYPQSVTQAYAMAANPAYYTPPAGYSPLSAPGYPSSASQGFHTTVGYPASLQSIPSTTMPGYPAQYAMPTYLGGAGGQLGATTASYAASGAIYPSSVYSSAPIAATQIQPGRGYSVSPMAYPQTQLGGAPTYPGASFQPQPPF